MSKLSSVAAFAGIALLAACSKKPANDSAAAFKPLDVGASVPQYAALTLAGDSIHVGGNEPPTVLNVWATWCTSCQEEMAALDSLRTQYQAKGLRVVAVSVDNGNIEKVRRFAESNHLGMTVAHDPMSSINQTFEVVGVPTTFIVGRDGKLLWRHTGNVTDVMADARAAVEKALEP
jgi:cytochrome c biogenesis protein CcmG/thiol:disulfide interchange protein DsbE